MAGALQSLVSVAAENAVGSFEAGVHDCARSNFVGEAKPACIQPVQQARKRFAAKIQFLQIKVQKRAHAAEH